MLMPGYGTSKAVSAKLFSGLKKMCRQYPSAQMASPACFALRSLSGAPTLSRKAPGVLLNVTYV
eukprot:scaffold105774_cov18-Tisochrysis_lutea.AAC.1